MSLRALPISLSFFLFFKLIRNGVGNLLKMSLYENSDRAWNDSYERGSMKSRIPLDFMKFPSIKTQFSGKLGSNFLLILQRLSFAIWTDLTRIKLAASNVYIGNTKTLRNFLSCFIP